MELISLLRQHLEEVCHMKNVTDKLILEQLLVGIEIYGSIEAVYERLKGPEAVDLA